MANIEENVERLISKTVEDLGYELYDVIYEKEAQDYYLRVFIDNPNGISLNDCEKVNDAINSMLDEADYIKEQYFLEVSSPGIERTLRKEKHLQANLGKEIVCNLFKPIEKRKQIEGILQEFDKEKLILKVQSEEKEELIEINRKNIAKMKLKYRWD